MRKRYSLYTATIIMSLVLMCGFTCNSGTKRLAVASDAVAHALLNAQTAAQQAQAAGIMSATEFSAFNTQLANVAAAGQGLDAAIKQNESATSVSQKVNNFLSAFNTLQQAGVVGIKDPKTQLAISTIITGAESSVAIIAATVGGK